MHASGRHRAWLVPLLLAWGGCAAPALVRGPVAELNEPASEVEASERDAQPPAIGHCDAARARQLALAKGFSPAAAANFEQIIASAAPQDRQFVAAYCFGQINGVAAESQPASALTVKPAESAEPPSPDTACRVECRNEEADHRPSEASETQSPADRTATPSVTAAPAVSPDSPVAAAATVAATVAATAASANQTASRSSSAPPIPPLPQASSTGLSSIDTSATRSVPTPAAAAESAEQAATPDGSPASQPSAAAEAGRSAGEIGPAEGYEETRIRLTTAAKDDSHSTVPPDSWQKQLRQAMTRLQQDLDSGSLDEVEAARLRTCLSLLQLAADDPERAMSTLEGMDEEQLEFWRQTIMGLGVLLDPQELPKLRHRVEMATEHLQKGVSTLATLGPLRLNNLTFCTSVFGYGDFVECDPYSLEAGREVLLYVEVENFTVDETHSDTSDGSGRGTPRRAAAATARVPYYTTELLARYDILDQNQRVVVSHTLPPNRDRSRNRRRDYFIPYSLILPKDLRSGSYTLELTIEDKKGNKYGNAVTDLRIR